MIRLPPPSCANVMHDYPDFSLQHAIAAEGTVVANPGRLLGLLG
ncbi:MAG: hypothetical protein Q8S08_13170 [Halomonas sp.]|nr:hypothetical protein [Halomonas sp.]MDP3536329.1 hypothetical protein [Halomonas sp.]